MNLETYNKAHEIRLDINEALSDIENIKILKNEDGKVNVICDQIIGFDFSGTFMANAFYKMEMNLRANIEKLEKEFEAL